jgi:type II secretory pathway pseudopilin PulG
MWKGEGDGFNEYLGGNENLLSLRPHRENEDEDGEKETGVESESSSDSSDEEIRQNRPRRRYQGAAIHGSGTYTHHDNRTVNIAMQAPVPIPAVQALQVQTAQVQLQAAQVQLQQQQTVLQQQQTALQQQQMEFYLKVASVVVTTGLTGLTLYKKYKNTQELTKDIATVLSNASKEDLKKIEEKESTQKVRWILVAYQSKLAQLDNNDSETRTKLSQEYAAKLIGHITALSQDTEKNAGKENSWCLTM